MHTFVTALCLVTLAATAAPVAPASPPGTAAAFTQYVESLNKKDVNSISKAAAYFEKHLMHAPDAECAPAARQFEAFLLSLSQSVMQDNTSMDWRDIGPFVKAQSEEFLKNGLVPYECEGGLDCFVSPDSSLPIFKPFLQCDSPQVKAFFALPRYGHQCAGYMVGTFSELGKYIGERERFMAKFPDSIFLEQVKQYRDGARVDFFLGGHFCFDAFGRHGQISSEALAAYQSYMSTYPGTETADLLRRYVAVLEQNDKRFCRPVYDFLKQQVPAPVPERLGRDFDFIQEYFASDDNCSIEVFKSKRAPENR